MNDMTTPNVPQTITLTEPSRTVGEVSNLLAIAKGFQVTDDETAQLAVDECKEIATMRKGIEEERVKITKPLLEAKRATDALFQKLTDPLDQAERAYKSKLITYRQASEQKAREIAAAAAEAARKEREKLEREALAAEKKGKVEVAEQKRDVAAMIPTHIEAAPTATFAGFSQRKNWKARVPSKIALIQWVAAHPEFEALLDANESKCNAQAKTHEGKLSDVIPPLSPYDDAVGALR